MIYLAVRSRPWMLGGRWRTKAAGIIFILNGIFASELLRVMSVLAGEFAPDLGAFRPVINYCLPFAWCQLVYTVCGAGSVSLLVAS